MKSLLLICALGLAHADCSIDTAMAVIQGPVGGGPAQCGFLAQAYLADTALTGYLENHYLKVICSPGRPQHAGTQPEPGRRSVADR